ncbi:hypothetical protein C7M84_013430 [Penaeus vannamei]|uniref:Uncharacterized protein n=1 Tax=Penaeus vannamei TaxID=6689 RepID=A0A3R7MS33_PENVA|nr:hypothetical protein C7M84_013430 [Penaeus vannamei]
MSRKHSGEPLAARYERTNSEGLVLSGQGPLRPGPGVASSSSVKLRQNLKFLRRQVDLLGSRVRRLHLPGHSARYHFSEHFETLHRHMGFAITHSGDSRDPEKHSYSQGERERGREGRGVHTRQGHLRECWRGAEGRPPRLPTAGGGPILRALFQEKGVDLLVFELGFGGRPVKPRQTTSDAVIPP